MFIPTSRDKLQAALAEGRGDIVSANVTITASRQELVDFITPTLTEVKELVVTGPGARALTTLDDLSGQTVHVREQSIYRESLETLNASLKQRGKPAIDIQNLLARWRTKILEMVNAGLVKITVVDDTRQFLETSSRHDGSRRSRRQNRREVAMAVRKGSPKLKAELDAFVSSAAEALHVRHVVLRKYLQSVSTRKVRPRLRRWRGSNRPSNCFESLRRPV